ncbi:guanosine-3',5'-bis(diphosphate) 3'-pyrophosphohydrolase [Dysgonomonas sp. PH5-45]|uniref:RelA/SpoT family protein n=1 Tax=unclassified Dysgonomonas TaxID=2630389 RepID=UPI0024760C78|nr:MULTISPECIES: RelA/SpoT family protein [unclassified Dysgonomonas]MDH6355431.1 guanosine-3',5'-bis(diphosphate) 3'-pyrophosphohydrolase [Dysgonomonas sp. PH5-45]MDH6388328.1 guanosine-3',5'-bis(diphosphate) 3'-pyrophosphohydrolase [Dysgonomonas sp. PH5-37]
MERKQKADKGEVYPKIPVSVYKHLHEILNNNLQEAEIRDLKNILFRTLRSSAPKDRSSIYGTDLILATINTVFVIVQELGLKHTSILAALLYRPVQQKVVSLYEVEKLFGKDVGNIVQGLIKVSELDTNQSTLGSDNFLKLLLSFAEDMRVILIMIANRLYLMRYARYMDEKARFRLTIEVFSLYIPLSHKLGLYKVKSEMEDLYLKYTDREAYDFISHKINESKASRDKYIARFIAPINEKLKSTGLQYDIKGRTKSIYSINNKLKKQQIDFESIYDLFAIRIVLDSDLEKEKSECWQTYSIVTDLYVPNPKRLKDWLSIPKSNGYESLHTTVMGPESRWVEVQIRTRRMDEIAERGLAAHWKYKGVKSQSNVDDWLTNLRETLENRSLDLQEKMEDFKLDIYDDEVYVFTPKGDLHKLPQGATVLDFAFSIHSKLGCSCVSGKVNGRNVPIRYKLKSGDQVEIITSVNQTPKQDWLNFVTTTKARNKIRQSLKEESSKQVDDAKELLRRRFKNRKIEEDDATLMRLIKKLGFKNVTDFYVKIAEKSLDVNHVIDRYLELENKDSELREKHGPVSAEEYIVHSEESLEGHHYGSDELIIDKNLTGIEYQLAKCCNPIYGDEIFGFISSHGIKIHRKNCPNARDMFTRFAYRVLAARWSGKFGAAYTVTLRVIGHDDIGIITNLTSIISKEDGVVLRSINIDSDDGIFQGNLSVTLSNTQVLDGLIKKLKTVKGVKQISRLNG